MTKILIIDDEDGHRLMVRAVMSDAGYDVDEAGSGEDGLQCIESESPPDVVLLDIHLPGMDGMETLRAIRKRNNALPRCHVDCLWKRWQCRGGNETRGV